jgi:hypothetical protein
MSKYTREHLQQIGKNYVDAVIDNETNIFVKYVGQGILKYAALGERKVYFPIADYSGPIQRLPNGNLNRYDPGPIPKTYLPEVIRKLQVFFPDTDFITGDKSLWINWT